MYFTPVLFVTIPNDGIINIVKSTATALLAFCYYSRLWLAPRLESSNFKNLGEAVVLNNIDGSMVPHNPFGNFVCQLVSRYLRLCTL